MFAKDGTTDNIVAEAVAAAVLTSCQVALVNNPAACRAALSKQRAVIGPTLAKNLEVVGNFIGEVSYSLFWVQAFNQLP